MTILFYDRYRTSYDKATKGAIKATNRVIDLDQIHGDAIDLSAVIRDDDDRSQQQSVFNIFNRKKSLQARISPGDVEPGYKTIMNNVEALPTGFRERCSELT